jgi:ATP-dependent Lhr-like helicase
LHNSNFYKLHKKLQELLIVKGFKSLRPIQEKSIDIILNNENLLILAPTASGKTEAALLPIISSIFNEDDLSLKCLYVAPLKALLNDIEERLLALKRNDDAAPYILKWHGDVPRSKKLKSLKEIPDILLITPESLEVLLVSPYIDHRNLFKKIRYAVIDEIHNFAFSPRGSQLLSILSRIDDISVTPIQRIGLSATIGNPSKILEWMCNGSPLKSQFITSTESSKIPEIQIIYLEPDDTNAYLDNLRKLCSNGKTLIFNNSKSSAEQVSKDLESIGINSYVHHGSVAKFIREDAEDKIKHESHGVISATSTLELGIDIGDLDKVIQIQNLPSINSFLQRIGRTGRRSGKNPFIACLTSDYHYLLLDIAIVSLGIIDKYSEPLLPSDKRFDILLQQLLSEGVSRYGANKHRFFNTVRKAYCFKGITGEEYEELIKYWVDNNIIRIENEDVLLGTEGERVFGRKNYLELYSVFEASDQYEVICKKESIGVLDSRFVNSKEGNFLFRLAGRKWKVLEIDDERSIIEVIPTTEGITPFWNSGGFFNVDYRVAQRAREILGDEFDTKLIKLGAFEEKVLDIIRKEKEFEIIQDLEIKLVLREDSIYVFTYAGTMLNDILAILLKRYSNIAAKDIDCFKLEFKEKGVSLKSIFDLLNDIKLKENYDSVFKILYEEMRVWRYSKYSEYIPENLSKNFILSNYFGITEFLEYIHTINLTCQE